MNHLKFVEALIIYTTSSSSLCVKRKGVISAVSVIFLALLAALFLNNFVFIDAVKQALIFLTVVAHVVVALMLASMLFSLDWFFMDWMRADAVQLSFIVALVATSGSLFYSQVAGYTPCLLCWFQRIFMYPLVILLGVAIYRDDSRKMLRQYLSPMTVFGGLIAVWHYITQVTEAASGCTAGGVDCGVPWIFHLGYITIPLMALTGFTLITLFLFSKD